MGIIVSQMDMWVLGIVMAVLIAIVMIIGLIALYIVCTMIIRHTTQPLHALSDAVNEVAKGRFDVPLPKVYPTTTRSACCATPSKICRSLWENMWSSSR